MGCLLGAFSQVSVSSLSSAVSFLLPWPLVIFSLAFLSIYRNCLIPVPPSSGSLEPSGP